MAYRILVVEDEPLIAYGLEQDLADGGFEVVGIADRVDAAVKTLDVEKVDAVVLDANLHGNSSEPVAEKLEGLKIPYLVVTGYSSKQIGNWGRNAQRLKKPYDCPDLITAIQNLLEPS